METDKPGGYFTNSVSHGDEDYVRIGEVHINGIEGF